MRGQLFLRATEDAFPALARFLEDEPLLLCLVSAAFLDLSLIEREHVLNTQLLTLSLARGQWASSLRQGATVDPHDVESVLRGLGVRFEDYNDYHPHRGLAVNSAGAFRTTVEGALLRF
jgi:hypothetical protein